MNKFLIGLSVLVLSFTSQAQAGDVLHASKSIQVNVSADKAWKKIANFGDLGAWHPAVAKTDIVEGAHNVKGAKRVLTLQDGGKINETLTAYSAEEKTMSYIITESVLPVSDYSATLEVKSAGKDKSIVTWVADFEHKDGADDKTAKDTINGVFDGGLGNLKKLLEAI
ncbi:MAG: SRPBCC family protein [Methylophilaceae bacterium]